LFWEFFRILLGRPKRVFRRDVALSMRDAGVSWRKIAAALDVPMATVIDACKEPQPARRSRGTD